MPLSGADQSEVASGIAGRQPERPGGARPVRRPGGTPQAGSERPSATESDSGPGVAAQLDPRTLWVEPGGAVSASVKVANRSQVVDELVVEVLGDASPWAKAFPASVSLFPGASGTVEIQLRPPRGESTVAGPVPLGVRVRSVADPRRQVIVEGVVEVGSFHAITASVTPKTSHGSSLARHELTIENQGNRLARLQVAAGDPDQALTYGISQPSVNLRPGDRAVVEVQPQSKRRNVIGRPRSTPFQAVVTPDGGDQIVAEATFVQTPLIPRWALTAALVALALLGVLAVWAFTRPGPVGVPGVIGDLETNAISKIIAAGLQAGDRSHGEDPMAAGLVVRTNPAEGTPVERGSKVDYFVSDGPPLEPVPVPQLVGSPESVALDLLRTAGLRPGTRSERRDPLPQGQIVETDPIEGTPVVPDTAINYVVSLGPEPTAAIVAIPNVQGRTEAEAVQILLGKGLAPGTTTLRFHDEVAQDRVIRTIPAAGEHVPPETVINLVVSRGPRPTPTPAPTALVPDVRGFTEDEAIAAILDTGFDVGERVERPNAEVPAGLVIRTRPRAGESAEVGATVDYFVSLGPEPTPVPTPEPTPVPLTELTLSGGSATVSGTSCFDVEDGAGGCSGEPDIWWEQIDAVQRRLSTWGGSMLAYLGFVDFDATSLEALQQQLYSQEPINGNDDATNLLTPGAVVAVLTSGGHYAKVRIDSYGYDLAISWLTYDT
jgi:beta-lactam-binding protein with PASTA domain